MSISEWPIQQLGSMNDVPISLQSIGNPKRVSKALIMGIQRKLYKEVEEASLKKTRGYMSNIQSFVEFHYPLIYRGGIKKDAPLLTTTTGAYREIYGNFVWEQIIQEANAFGLLPKVPWDKSGWRVITAAGAVSGGGVAENDALPATIKPTFALVTTKAKTVATAFDVSALEQAHGMAGGDDMWEDPFGFLRDYSAREHVKLINRMLLTDNDTLAANNFESIDRVIGSNSEIAGVGQTAGDLDIYALDRDAGATWADSYVNHNSGVDRDITLSIIDSLFENTYPYRDSGDPYILLTGYDTFERIQQLRSNQIQYLNPPTGYVRQTLNGVQQVQAGTEGGFQIATYKGVPIFTSNDVPKDTISRIYLINLNHLKIKVLLPTQYFQSGLFTTGDPFGLDADGRLGDEGLFVTMAELWATKFNVHAKGRDFQ